MVLIPRFASRRRNRARIRLGPSYLSRDAHANNSRRPRSTKLNMLLKLWNCFKNKMLHFWVLSLFSFPSGLVVDGGSNDWLLICEAGQKAVWGLESILLRRVMDRTWSTRRGPGELSFFDAKLKRHGRLSSYSVGLWGHSVPSGATIFSWMRAPVRPLRYAEVRRDIAQRRLGTLCVLFAVQKRLMISMRNFADFETTARATFLTSFMPIQRSVQIRQLSDGNNFFKLIVWY